MTRGSSNHLSGFSLIELALTLSVSGLVMAGVWNVMGSSGNQRDIGTLSSHAYKIAKASQDYINANRDILLALGGLSSINNVVRIKLTSSDTGSTTTDVVSSGFLPSTTSLTNSYGQSYALYVQRQDSGASGVDSDDRLVGLLITTGGTSITDKMGSGISAAIGAAGGFMYADSNPASPTAATTIRGAMGGWTVNLSGAGWSSTVGATATRGHLGILLAMLSNSPMVSAAVSSSGSGGGSAAAIDDLTDGQADYTTNYSLYMGGSADSIATSGALSNTAIGISNMTALSGADQSTALGYKALNVQSSGASMTALGSNAALTANTDSNSVAVGAYALTYTNGASANNTAIGYQSLMGTTSSRVSGSNNVAIGVAALKNNSSGSNNVALGNNAAITNVAGSDLTAIGSGAMSYANDTSVPFTTYNTAFGTNALQGSAPASGNTGKYNTAIGYNSMLYQKTGSANTAIGYATLDDGSGNDNTVFGSNVLGTTSNGISGARNTAVGRAALANGYGGNDNTFMGSNAGYYSGAGSYNTAIGYQAHMNNASGGSANTVIGAGALFTATLVNNAVAVGYNALTLYNGVAESMNTAVGAYAGAGLTTGTANTISGYQALQTASGATNTIAIGAYALQNTTSVSSTIAIGYQAFKSCNNLTSNIIIGNYYATPSCSGTLTGNIAIGQNALNANTGTINDSIAIGSENLSYGANSGDIALGNSSLYKGNGGSISIGQSTYQVTTSTATNFTNAGLGKASVASGTGVTTLGHSSENALTTASYITAVGMYAGNNNKVGSGLTAFGNATEAYGDTTTTAYTLTDTAVGYSALYGYSATSYSHNGNTAIGAHALQNIQTGSNNTAIGYNAAFSGAAITTGSNNTFVGTSTTSNNAAYTNGTALGYGAQLTASNRIVLGNASVTGLYAAVTSITAISDRRHKRAIKDLDLGLDFIASLRPRSYRFSTSPEQTLRFGFIAQEVEQALPARLSKLVNFPSGQGLALLSRQSDDERTYRLAYDELLAPLLASIQTLDTRTTHLGSLTRQTEQALPALAERLSRQRERLLQLEAHLEASDKTNSTGGN
jgi:hypothetical protein